ncbi:hypothetical protein ACHAPJ_012452 [Fusarium lateritium]
MRLVTATRSFKQSSNEDADMKDGPVPTEAGRKLTRISTLTPRQRASITYRSKTPSTKGDLDNSKANGEDNCSDIRTPKRESRTSKDISKKLKLGEEDATYNGDEMEIDDLSHSDDDDIISGLPGIISEASNVGEAESTESATTSSTLSNNRDSTSEASL